MPACTGKYLAARVQVAHFIGKVLKPEMFDHLGSKRGLWEKVNWTYITWEGDLKIMDEIILMDRRDHAMLCT